MPRTRLVVNVGNLLELLGCAAIAYGVSRIAGLGVALIVSGILGVAAAELVYDAHVWRVPLPHTPRPRARLARTGERLRWWRLRHKARRRARSAPA